MAPNNQLQWHNFNLRSFLDLTLKCFSCHFQYLSKISCKKKKLVPSSCITHCGGWVTGHNIVYFLKERNN